MTLVRQDSHGLYVRTGGIIFRPQLSYYAARQGYSAARTKYVKGESVKARHVGGTVTSRVGGELWFSHGESFGWDLATVKTYLIPSEESWSLTDPTRTWKICEACSRGYPGRYTRCTSCGASRQPPPPPIIQEEPI